MPHFTAQTMTKTRRKAGSYMKLAEKFLSGNGKLRDEFALLQQEMNQLTGQLDHLYTANALGDFPTLDEEQLEMLTQRYSKCHEAAVHMMESCKAAGLKEDSPARRSVEAVAKCLAADRRVLDRCNPEDELTLPEFMGSLHTTVIDLSDARKKTVQGATNTRIPIKIRVSSEGEKTKFAAGMFTEETNSDVQETEDEMMNSLRIGIDGSLYSLYVSCGQDYDNFRQLLLNITVKRNQKGEIVRLGLKPGYRNDDGAFMLRQEIDMFNSVAESEKDMDLSLREIVRWGERLQFVYRAQSIRNSAGIPVGANTDRRNCAMNAVADLLGMPDIIARSVPMAVRNDDKLIRGTFMEFAEGSDIHHLTKKDNLLKVRQATIMSSRHSSGLAMISDLQVLDFICGNTQRHNGNVFWQFSKDGYLQGVQGIDNDTSFGLIKDDALKGDQPLQYFVSLKNMRFVSEETAKTIRSLTPEMLATVISGFGLSPQEIKAACHRLELLKNSLDDTYIRNPDSFDERQFRYRDGVFVLSKEQQKKINLRDLSRFRTVGDGKRKIGDNGFGTVENVMRNVPQFRKIAGKNSDPTAGFTEVAVERRYQMPNFMKYSRTLFQHMKKMEEVNQGLFISSPEFNNVLNYTGYMVRQLYDMSGLEKEEDRCRKAYGMFENLYALTAMYLDHKNSDGSLEKSETARKRVLAVTELQNMVEDYAVRFGYSDRDQYRRLCEKQRRGVFDRRQDAAAISEAIRRLNDTHQEAKAQELETDFSQLIDGIGRKGWKKTLDSYGAAADELTRNMNDPEGLPKNLYDAVSQLRQTLREIRDPECLNRQKGQDVMDHLKERLEAVSHEAASVLREGKYEDTEDHSLTFALHELIRLSGNAADNSAVPDYRISDGLAQAVLGKMIRQNELTGGNGHRTYNSLMTEIRSGEVFRKMTGRMSERKMNEILSSPLEKADFAEKCAGKILAERAKISGGKTEQRKTDVKEAEALVLK